MPLDIEAFAPNQGASRWVVSTPGRELTRHIVRKQTRQQLLDEAAQLVPNEQALAKQLLSWGMSPVDDAKAMGQLTPMLSEYLGEYRKNPFYAFSREGINNTRKMQYLVNDPRLKAASDAFKSSQEVYKQLDKYGVIDNIAVENGLPMVFDKETGEVEPMDPSKIDWSRKVPMRVRDVWQYYNHSKGYLKEKMADIRALTSNIVDPKEATEYINNWFGGLGTTEKQQFIDLSGQLKNMSEGEVTYTTKSNAMQLTKKLNALLSAAGMPEKYRDTIYSQIYTRGLSPDKPVSREMVEGQFQNYIGDIALSREIYEDKFGNAPKAYAAAAGGGGKDRLVGRGFYYDFATGQADSRALRANPANPYGNKVQVAGKMAPRDFFEVYERNNIKRGLLDLTNNDVYNRLVDPTAQPQIVGNPDINVVRQNTIPAKDPQLVVYQSPYDNKMYMEFDALTLSGGSYDDLPRGTYTTVDTPDQEHWNNMLDVRTDLKEKGMYSGEINDTQALRIDDVVKVRIKVPLDENFDVKAQGLDGDPSVQVPVESFTRKQKGDYDLRTRILE